MTKKKLRLVAILLGTLGLKTPAFAQDGGWWDDVFRVREVSLEAVLRAPEAHRARTVSMVVQFHQLGRLPNPFHTRFDDDTYLNFSVWDDGTPLWEKEAYKNDFSFMLVRRQSREAEVLTSAPLYSRWLLKGEVAEVFNGVPWIEVRALQRLDSQMDEPSLALMVKAFMLQDLRRFDSAAREFRSAEHKGLPPSVRVRILREEALCLHQAGKTSLGVARLQTALQILPGDEPCRQALQTLRSHLGEGGENSDGND